MGQSRLRDQAVQPSVAYGVTSARPGDDRGDTEVVHCDTGPTWDYLQRRIAEHDTAEPIEACPTYVAR